MRTLAWISFIGYLVFVVIGSIFLTIQGYELNRDIESVAHRAQVAADADDMLAYMKTMKANMERHNMTVGHSALIFKTPENDLSLMYESVNSIIERLEFIRELPKSETAYQVGLDDLRGTIRELESPSVGLVWVRNWVLTVLLGLLWVWPLVHLFREDF